MHVLDLPRLTGRSYYYCKPRQHRHHKRPRPAPSSPPSPPEDQQDRPQTDAQAHHHGAPALATELRPTAAASTSSSPSDNSIPQYPGWSAVVTNMAGIYRRSTLPAPNLHPPFINPAPKQSRSTAEDASSSFKVDSSKGSSRDTRDLTGRWVADDLCSNCGGPTQESRLYCSEKCLQEELQAARRRESDQIAHALAEAQLLQQAAVQAQAYQAMADVDIEDDWEQRSKKQQHRYSLPLPFAQPLTPSASAANVSPSHVLGSLSRDPSRSVSSNAARSRSGPLTASAVNAIEPVSEAALPFSKRRFSAARPRPPASDASSSSMASLSLPSHQLPASKSPLAFAQNPSAAVGAVEPLYRSSSASSQSSGQQRQNGAYTQRRSRSRSSTQSETTTSTSDDAYTTGPGTPSPAIQPDKGIVSGGTLGFIHEDDAEPTLLSLPPSIGSPEAVLLNLQRGSAHSLCNKAPASAFANLGKNRGPDDISHPQYAGHPTTAAMYAATYTAHRSPILSPLQQMQLQQQQYGRSHNHTGSKSNPATPWRGAIPLPDSIRKSPALLPVISPSPQTMRFARRPSSTAMPRMSTSGAPALSAATAPSPFIGAVAPILHDINGHIVSALSSPVLTPTSSGTASTTPTASVGHVAGLTSSSMPHGLSFFRPHTSASPAVTKSSLANRPQPSNALPPAAPRRNTRERIGFMTPVFPSQATAAVSAGVAASSRMTSGKGSASRNARSRSHSTARSNALPATESASDFAHSTSEEEGNSPNDDVLSDLELETRGRSQAPISSYAATSDGSETINGSRISLAPATTVGRTSTGPSQVAEQPRGRSRAQGDRSSSRRGRSPPRGAARNETSVSRPASGNMCAERPAVTKDVASSPPQKVQAHSPTIPLRPVTARSPALSPRTAAPQPTAESSTAHGAVVHPSHALFGVNTNAEARDTADPNTIAHPPQGGESSWERASPLAKLARKQQEEEQRSDLIPGRNDAPKEVIVDEGEARGRSRSHGPARRRSPGPLREVSRGRNSSRSPLSSEITAAMKHTAPAPAPTIDPGFDDVEIDLDC